MLTKAEALDLYGGRSAKGASKRLAAALGLSKQAVSFWPMNRPIPEVHELKLRYELRPDAFAQNNTNSPGVAHARKTARPAVRKKRKQ